MNEAAAVEFSDEFKGSVFRNTDWYFLLTTIIVFIVYAVLVAYVSTIPIPEPTEEDIKRLQDQFAKFVLKEKPLEEEVEEEGLEEAGAVTEAEKKATERVEGRKSASAEEKAAARQAQAAERAAAREKAAAAVANVGALAMLTAVGDAGEEGGDEVEDLLGSGGIQSANLGKALSSLDGLKAGGAGTSTGRGRRGRRGGQGGVGGGGVDDLLSGVGGAGSRSLSRKGSISLAKREAVKSSGQAARSANRNFEAINNVIKQKQGALQFCFKKELRKNPKLSGKVTVRFTIQHTGRVTNATVTTSTIGSKSLEQCLMKTIRRLKFKPIDASEGSMTVTYPFVFAAG